MSGFDSCDPTILCSGLGFEWNVWYVYDEMHRNAEEEEEEEDDEEQDEEHDEQYECAMNVFREFSG